MKSNMETEQGAQGPALDVPDGHPARRAESTSAYVLVVDDDPVIRALMDDLLREEGYAFTIASGGTEALARAPAAPPALILLDRSLRNELASEVAAALRARAGWAETPLALFTGGAAGEAAGLARELGVVEVVAKPFDLGELLAVLERYVRPSKPPAHQPASGASDT